MMQQTQQIDFFNVPKPIELAIRFGLIKPGYTLEDYLVEAATTEAGYETVDLWGVQGSGKSSRMLQMLYWIYEDWEEVLNHIIFKPSTLVETLEEVPDNEVLPALGWDDIGVHYPSSKFKTDIKQYEAVDSTWAAIRTKVHVVITTIPLIDRLAKNVKDNVTFEVFLGKNQMELINRVFRLPGTQSIESNFFKVAIERPSKFDLFFIPPDIWARYWKMRLRLTKEALSSLRSSTDMENVEGYIPVLEASLRARDMGIKLSPTTLQQNISRGVLRGTKISDQLCVLEEDYLLYLETKARLQ